MDVIYFSGYTACNEALEFECDNGFCISREFECDGKDHCGDNSDEIIPCGMLLVLIWLISSTYYCLVKFELLNFVPYNNNNNNNNNNNSLFQTLVHIHNKT